MTIDGLTETVDYTLIYENNINPGKGIVCVNGIGNLIGVIELEYEIEPHSPGVAVKENIVESITAVEGSYDEVTYCKISNKILSRIYC